LAQLGVKLVVNVLTPPDVGAAEASSAMLIPTTVITKLATAHWRHLLGKGLDRAGER
jgi:hypothetical protein